VSQATTQAEAPPPPPADTTPPTVSMTPTSGATVKGTISIVVNASDNKAISKMTLAIDGKVVSTKLNPGATGNITYSWNTRNATVGSHTLTAEVTDSSNLVRKLSYSVTVRR
jgi:thermitase